MEGNANAIKDPLEEEGKEIDEIDYPDDDWYNLQELDLEDHLVSYTVNGKPRKMKFCFKARSNNEMRAIRAEHQTRNAAGMIETDQEMTNDDTILACVGKMVNENFVSMSRQQLDKIKLNKKDGLYAALWLQSIKQSDVSIDAEKIEKQKN
jgi:hypothetical protein